MHTNKEKIHVVWLKCDLRLQDNEAIFNALNSDKRVLFIYVFENSLLNDPHYDKRHWDFIKESITDLNEDLKTSNTKVLSITSEIIPAFNRLQNTYKIDTVFSHQETGLLITYNRNKDFKRYCRNNSIDWVENSNNGVLRGLLNRKDWFEQWGNYMSKKQFTIEYQQEKFLLIDEIRLLENNFIATDLTTQQNRNFQKGGTKTAWKYANTFFDQRHKQYMYHISKPAASRESCSRLSPYIAWGNVSIRQMYQKAKEIKNKE